MTHACSIFGHSRDYPWTGVCVCGQVFRNTDRDAAFAALCDHLGYVRAPWVDAP